MGDCWIFPSIEFTRGYGYLTIVCNLVYLEYIKESPFLFYGYTYIGYTIKYSNLT